MAMSTYDDVYSKPELYWEPQPNQLCTRVIEAFGSGRGARVVDLGCGEGKDVIHFAKNGFDPVGVDISLPGLQKAGCWAADEGHSIMTVQAHLDAFELENEFDIVYSSGTLTYLSPERRSAKFAHYKEHTKIGGLNAFNLFVEKPFIETPPDWGTDEYFYRSGDLLHFYWDWESLTFEEVIFDCQ